MKKALLLLMVVVLIGGCAKVEDKKTIAVLETTMGDIEVELFEKEAPATTKNFADYVSEGFYDDLIFHRVINGFMVQAGGFDRDMSQKKAKAPIKNEAANGLKNKRGTIAMARTMVIDSATSQFFINVADNDFLDYKDSSMQGYGYAVFGRVVSGMDAVDKIESVKAGSIGDFQDVPLEPIIIKRAYIKK